MEVTSVTVGLPVSDLGAAVRWYQVVLGLGAPGVEPAQGVVEFEVGPVVLQLVQGATARTGAQVVVRLGVADATAERGRLLDLGVDAQPVHRVEGAVDFFDVVDPDGNALCVYSLLA